MERDMYKKIMIIGTLLIMAQVVFGQITYKTKVTSYGFMGMGAFESTTKTYLQGDAQRSDSKLKFTGAFMKMLSPKGTVTSIIRLDKELVWNFNDKKKKYTEQTFEEMRKTFEELEEAGYSQDMQGASADEDYEEEYKWSKPVVKVKNLKENKKINEFSCQHYLASVTTVGTHIETGIKDTMLFVSDLWNAKNVSKKMELEYDFNKRYMKAIGVDIPENQGLAMIAGMYKEHMQTLADEISKLKGYPIVNDMKLTMTKNLASVEQEEMEEEEPEKESLSMRDIQRNFGGLLGKKVAKDIFDKKAEKKTEKPQKATVSELFHMKSEVLSINEGSISADVFEVKKGYKLKKN